MSATKRPIPPRPSAVRPSDGRGLGAGASRAPKPLTPAARSIPPARPSAIPARPSTPAAARPAAARPTAAATPAPRMVPAPAPVPLDLLDGPTELGLPDDFDRQLDVALAQARGPELHADPHVDDDSTLLVHPSDDDDRTLIAPADDDDDERTIMAPTGGAPAAPAFSAPAFSAPAPRANPLPAAGRPATPVARPSTPPPVPRHQPAPPAAAKRAEPPAARPRTRSQAELADNPFLENGPPRVNPQTIGALFTDNLSNTGFLTSAPPLEPARQPPPAQRQPPPGLQAQHAPPPPGLQAQHAPPLRRPSFVDLGHPSPQPQAPFQQSHLPPPPAPAYVPPAPDPLLAAGFDLPPPRARAHTIDMGDGVVVETLAGFEPERAGANESTSGVWRPDSSTSAPPNGMRPRMPSLQLENAAASMHPPPHAAFPGAAGFGQGPQHAPLGAPQAPAHFGQPMAPDPALVHASRRRARLAYVIALCALLLFGAAVLSALIPNW